MDDINDSPKWEIDPAWGLTFQGKPAAIIGLQDPEGWYKAQIRFDGCVHFYRCFNLPYSMHQKPEDVEEDYLHICDIDDLITRLQAIKVAAIAHFGESWPN